MIRSLTRPMQRRPDCGRPYDVLRYLDYCLDPKRPFVVNLNGGPGEMFRALREAEAGMWAAHERFEYEKARIDALRRLIEAYHDLDRLNA